MKYSQVIKKDDDQKVPVVEKEQDHDDMYIHTFPKVGGVSYNRWKDAYIDYLEMLYSKLELEVDKEEFFKVLYQHSSGEITKYI
jgi:desulfoferrodoxin (superoxide reductase-like protein)